MSSPDKPTPLYGFSSLNKSVFLYSPNAASTKSSQESPDLIVLCSWMGAAPRNIAKYTSVYMNMYPQADILLITAAPALMFFWSYSALQRHLAPAVEVISAQASNQARILLHTFSNGGATQANQLALAYKAKEGGRLPISAMVIDSAPGAARYRKTINAMVVGFPQNRLIRLIGTLMAHIVLSIVVLKSVILRTENPPTLLRRVLLDKTLYPLNAPRCFLFSEADQMIWHRDVEDHIESAKANGFSTSKALFKNSPHCGHIREDGDRYWKAVEEVWARANP